MREIVGISRNERWPPVKNPPGAGKPGWHISNDITRDSLESIIENAEDLFT